MKAKIIFQKIKPGPASREEQRAMARALILRATGKKLAHSQTGRPLAGKAMDVSISHMNDLVCVGLVPKPYRIGVDIERIDVEFDAALFFGPVITRVERVFFRAFCESNNLSLPSGVAVFWSVKEAFFKCLDYDLKPGKIKIAAIAGNGEVKIDCTDEIKDLMAERRLRMCSIKTFFDRKRNYARAIMEEIRS
ncbi:MAG: 4'-phosphopantetheinyl transferase superfamily protein [Candidatus Portnoybacteria bacterium]|nr:4'-phosphopantetheinyl transferase superfamily protein [Candidatus Portnoybacteria bacterium]MDD4982897.1 4'-phosphopantetheinyl transferase superfamily protein [Candidatus Portnoybacteria bacterium]